MQGLDFTPYMSEASAIEGSAPYTYDLAGVCAHDGEERQLRPLQGRVQVSPGTQAAPEGITAMSRMPVDVTAQLCYPTAGQSLHVCR